MSELSTTTTPVTSAAIVTIVQTNDLSVAVDDRGDLLVNVVAPGATTALRFENVQQIQDHFGTRLMMAVLEALFAVSPATKDDFVPVGAR